MGGCGLSNPTEYQVGQALGMLPKIRYGWEKRTVAPADGLTLGQIQDACIVAGREIARFGLNHLGLSDWAVVETEY